MSRGDQDALQRSRTVVLGNRQSPRSLRCSLLCLLPALTCHPSPYTQKCRRLPTPSPRTPSSNTPQSGYTLPITIRYGTGTDDQGRENEKSVPNELRKKKIERTNDDCHLASARSSKSSPARRTTSSSIITLLPDLARLELVTTFFG